MIIALQSAIVSASINRGRSRLCLGLVDPLGIVEVVFVLVGGRQIRALDGVLVLALDTGAGGTDRPLDAGHQVADDLLGDQEEPLDLDDRLGRRLEEDDVVRALPKRADLIGQSTAAPRGYLDDLTAGPEQLSGRTVDDRLGLVV